jgi:hypothetical protein
MNVCDSRIWKISLAVGMLACSSSGCSLTRNSMADRATNIDRARVDELMDEGSGTKAANSNDDANSSTKLTGRQKLENWRDQRQANNESIPLDRTDQKEASSNDDAAATATTASNSLKGNVSRSSSPFDQALTSDRKIKPRAAKTDSTGKSTDASGFKLAEKNPFEE